jgi:hypothetical protein
LAIRLRGISPDHDIEKSGTYAGHVGYCRIEDELFHQTGGLLCRGLLRRYVKIAKADDERAGFIFALPSQ